MGLNAIFVFVASGLLGRVLLKSHVGIDKNAPTTYTWIYQNWFQPWAGTMNGSLAFAIVVVLFWWIILYVMYRQKWFIKL
jgi:predicted acyltransferase